MVIHVVFPKVEVHFVWKAVRFVRKAMDDVPVNAGKK